MRGSLIQHGPYYTIEVMGARQFRNRSMKNNSFGLFFLVSSLSFNWHHFKMPLRAKWWHYNVSLYHYLDKHPILFPLSVSSKLMSLLRSKTFPICTCLAAFFLLLYYSVGHGVMTDPVQRGLLAGSIFMPYYNSSTYPDAPKDFFAHFPSGKISVFPGSARLSQIKQAGTWSPFEPKRPGFVWRAGVCGDEIRRKYSRPQPHLRGGQFYYDGTVVREWEESSIIEIKVSIVAHHNGYLEFHICDLNRCGGKLSAQCFKNPNACHALQRAWIYQCEKPTAHKCGPMDRNYPTRWYLPCRREQLETLNVLGNITQFNRFGGQYMKYKLPHGFRCEHCVLHMYWVTGNHCNAPGVVDYFLGPDRPRAWEGCPGQADAVGGFSIVQRTCNATTFPEEYYKCADVRIVRKGDLGKFEKKRKGPLIRYVGLVKRDNRGLPVLVQKLTNDQHKNISIKKHEKLDFFVRVSRPVHRGVHFYLASEKNDGAFSELTHIRHEMTSPFYFGGDVDGLPNYWMQPIFNKKLLLVIKADGNSMRVIFALLT